MFDSSHTHDMIWKYNYVPRAFNSQIAQPAPVGDAKGVPLYAHVHAHIAHDGFYRQMSVSDTKRLAQLANKSQYTDPAELAAMKVPDHIQNLKPRSLKKILPEFQGLQNKQAKWDAMNLDEGENLDPATKGALDPERQVIDEVGKTAYYNRPVHSQFSDSEEAAMALYYTLLSPAGAEALNALNGGWNRASITSVTAAHLLGAGGQAPKKAVSYHPQRNQPLKMFARAAGNAGTNNYNAVAKLIKDVIVALDVKPDGRLHLVTMYPREAAGGAPAAQDSVTEIKYKPAYKKVVVNKAPVAAAAKPRLQWSEPDVAILPGQSRNTGIICHVCGAVHGTAMRGWFDSYWHRCGRCGNHYCPTCGGALASAAMTTRSRLCPKPGCSGRTSLIE
jgi:hypothetical protein